jgi:hypothetical protein
VACSGRKMRRGFWLGNLNKEDHLEDLGMNGRVIFK